MNYYLPSTEAEREGMLEAIGCSSYDDLYVAVPKEAFYGELDIPEGISELETAEFISALANKNKIYPSIFRGAGAYKRFIPPIVKTVIGREEFLTAYTPYQAEISQGVLQSIFEYQSMICELTGMDDTNASHYDGATAAAEAAIMCQERKRSRIVVSEGMNPQWIEVIKTYARTRGIETVTIPLVDGVTDADALVAALGEDGACGMFSQPNYYGMLEDSETLIAKIHETGAKAVMGVDPISLGILKTPGELGADVCVAEGQSLGLPLSFGGPYLGIIASSQSMIRKIPGRIVGQTVDSHGNRAFVLTLQAREQHIRREKASSNICSNQALCALAAGVYMASMGAKGIAKAAALGYSKAHYLAEQLCSIDGFEMAYAGEFFNEFVTTCSLDVAALEAYLAEKGILSGLPVGDGSSILWCATEMNSKAQIDALIDAIKSFDAEVN